MFVLTKNHEIIEVEDNVMYCSLPPQYIRSDNKKGILQIDVVKTSSKREDLL